MAIANVVITPDGIPVEGSLAHFIVTWVNALNRDQTVMMQWGDNTATMRDIPIAPPNYSYDFYHIYTRGGSFDISATVQDINNSTTNGTFVQVQNVPPVITSTSLVVFNSIGAAALNYTFTDVGTTEIYTITINWGDGHSTIWSTGRSGSYSSSHTYAKSGTTTPHYTVVLSISDGSDTVSANISPVFRYTEAVSSYGTTTLYAYGIVLYLETVLAYGTTSLVTTGFASVQEQADGDGTSDIAVSGEVDFASILVTSRDINRPKIGTIPFDQLITE